MMTATKVTLAMAAALTMFFAGTRDLHAQSGPDGASILGKADAYREYAASGFSFDFGVNESDGSSSLMRVSLAEGNRDTSLVRYVEPKKYRRRVVLTVKNAFFVYDQGMRSPIRITPREMLFGQASAGDITRIAFSGMYSIEGMETKDGRHTLHLKAIADKGATYDLIRLTVTASDCKPVRADCMGSGGSLIKTIEYDGFGVVNGKELLTSFTITDSASGDSCKVALGNFSAETYPASSFTVEAIKHVR